MPSATQEACLDLLKQEKIDVVATHITRSLIEIDVLDEQSESDAEKRMKSLKTQRTQY